MQERDQWPVGSKVLLPILFNVSILNMPTFKVSQSKKNCFIKKGLNKALNDMMEHNASLQKASKDNNIDWVAYVWTPSWSKEELLKGTKLLALLDPSTVNLHVFDIG